jgi:hypothetical protein
MKTHTRLPRLVFLLCLFSLNGCTVIAVADAVVSTTVKAGAAVVGSAIDVTRAGVKAATGSDSDEDNQDQNDGDQ